MCEGLPTRAFVEGGTVIVVRSERRARDRPTISVIVVIHLRLLDAHICCSSNLMSLRARHIESAASVRQMFLDSLHLTAESLSA